MQTHDMLLPIDAIKITATSEGQLTLGYMIGDKVVINRVMHAATGDSVTIPTPGFQLPLSVSMP